MADAVAEEIHISDGKFHPEGITATSDGRIYVGSLIESAVYVVSTDHASVVRLTEPGALGMDSAVGVKVNESTNRLFVCSGSVGVTKFSNTSAKPASVIEFDATDGTALKRYGFPGDNGFCNDIVIAEDGTVYATDSLNPRVLRLKPGAEELDVFVANEAFAGEWALNGLALYGGKLYVVKQNDGRMFSIDINGDGSSGTVSEIALPRPLMSPDGMLMLADGRALVVEGGRPGVVTFDPQDPSASWLEQPVEGLKVPSTAAVLPDGRIVVANTQNDKLGDPPGNTDPFTLTVFELK